MRESVISKPKIKQVIISICVFSGNSMTAQINERHLKQFLSQVEDFCVRNCWGLWKMSWMRRSTRFFQTRAAILQKPEICVIQPTVMCRQNIKNDTNRSPFVSYCWRAMFVNVSNTLKICLSPINCCNLASISKRRRLLFALAQLLFQNVEVTLKKKLGCQ